MLFCQPPNPSPLAVPSSPYLNYFQTSHCTHTHTHTFTDLPVDRMHVTYTVHLCEWACFCQCVWVNIEEHGNLQHYHQFLFFFWFDRHQPPKFDLISFSFIPFKKRITWETAPALWHSLVLLSVHMWWLLLVQTCSLEPAAGYSYIFILLVYTHTHTLRMGFSPETQRVALISFTHNRVCVFNSSFNIRWNFNELSVEIGLQQQQRIKWHQNGGLMNTTRQK